MSGEEQVVRVGAARRPEPHPGARARPRRRRRATVSVHGSTAASTAGSHHGTATVRIASIAAAGAAPECVAVQARPHSRAPCRRCGRRSRPRGGRCARASAFSSSVRVRTRSARISSISVASHRSPSLSGATSGWSYRMIGDGQHHPVVAARRAPGTCRRCRSPRPRPAAPSAGSSSETNAPSSTPSSVWTATSDAPERRRRASSYRPSAATRSRPPTVTFTSAPVPAGPLRGDAHDDVDRLAAAHQDAARGAVGAPQWLPLLAAGQCHELLVRSPPAAAAGARPAGRSRARPPRPTAPTATPSTSSSPTRRSRAGLVDSRPSGAAPAGSARARSAGASSPGSTTHSVRHRRPLGAVAPRRMAAGTSTPNCHRIWFFGADARYGYST